MKITIVGTGYVGLVTGTCFSEMGHKVYCIDIDSSRIADLKKNIIPIYEPRLNELVIDNQNKGKLFFSTDIKEGLDESTIVFIAVGTPMGENGEADLSYIDSVAKSIGENISHDMIIVVKSTVPVGTCDKIEQQINDEIKKRNENISIKIVSNPEFLKEGTAVRDCLHPDRVVLGSDDESALETMKELYSSFLLNHERFVLMDTKSAELTKYASNAMLATRISFMNEMANICEATGANIQKIRQGIGSDKRIGYNFLYAGCGYGGSCFPKDVNALINTSKQAGYEPKILQKVEEVNNNQKLILVDKIINKYGEDLSNLKIAIWGLSFKPGTNDIREAPSLVIIEELLKRGAVIEAFDPKAMKEASEYFSTIENISFKDSRLEVLKDADALILITEWKEFRNINFKEVIDLMKKPVIFDGRNIYNKKILKREGFELYQIGC